MLQKQLRRTQWLNKSHRSHGTNPHLNQGLIRGLHVEIAFEIIVHHFSGGKNFLSKQDIDNRVLEAHESQNGIPEFDETDPVNTVLYALKRFGFAEHIEHNCWRIKSVDDMCARLHTLVHNRNIGDEGEDF